MAAGGKAYGSRSSQERLSASTAQAWGSGTGDTNRTNEKIAITHLWHAIEPQTIYHLIAKDKVAEQHILGKHSNCNRFGVTMALLNSWNFKVAITQLSKVQQV